MARLCYIVTIMGIALMCGVLAEEVELYSSRFDDIDADSILQNDRLRDQYYNCFMGSAPCITADARFFKEIFSDALQSKCKRCTEKQKQMMDSLVDYFTKNKPEQWEALVRKSIEDLKKKNAER
ncbi:PREDICTED: ejaculatory bulb-specific protein 3-like [Wasmannia auropunctata]|uniref:ejaculatory bulb-specific protein 3-like n=1 Tax=Wasmannia auropunctata TaxID=64793 RepID=UPI0005EDE3F5|nr:PREDICTED: ejaculatory bulb-specific protein 3-like [Wasmannia auropunctata]